MCVCVCDPYVVSVWSSTLDPSMCSYVCVCVCLVMLCPLSRSCLLPWHLPSQFIYFCLFLFSVSFCYFIFSFSVFVFFVIVAFAFDFVCLSVEFVCRLRFALDYE